MYALASKLIHLPVLSLQSAETLTMVQELVVNPHSLSIAAFTCSTQNRKQNHPVIMPRDIRQIALDCLLIDNNEVIGEADEVVRLKPLIEAPYTVTGKRVVTEMGRTLGKIEDYVINLNTYEIQKFEVKPSLMQSWLGNSLMIDRSQVVEVNGNDVVVREASTGEPTETNWLDNKAPIKP